MSLTTKKHLVAMELELLSDTHSEGQEVLRTGLNRYYEPDTNANRLRLELIQYIFLYFVLLDTPL